MFKILINSFPFRFLTIANLPLELIPYQYSQNYKAPRSKSLIFTTSKSLLHVCGVVSLVIHLGLFILETLKSTAPSLQIMFFQFGIHDIFTLRCKNKYIRLYRSLLRYNTLSDTSHTSPYIAVLNFRKQHAHNINIWFLHKETKKC